MPDERPPHRIPATPVDDTGRRQALRVAVALGGAALGATRAAPVPAADPRAATAGLPGTSSQGRPGTLARDHPDPFTLGVASGYPHEQGMVLWTRLAPVPDAPLGGMSEDPVEVTVEIAHDEKFTNIVQRRTAWTTAEWAHSVHAEVAGLEPGRWYWYRFLARGHRSPTGRTRTTPPGDATDTRLRFGAVCCQHYELGYFSAYRALVDDAPDLIVHLGDYLYEGHGGADAVRRLDGPPPVTLDDYRVHHARYKRDPDLQRAHAACPWLLTWDDHEVENDYAADRSGAQWPRQWFLARRAAAYRAYYEHMPLPRWMLPVGPEMRIHTEWWFGRLARFFMLDTRQYRDDEVCPDKRSGFLRGLDPGDCPPLHDPARTMLGWQQRRWLFGRLPGNPEIPWTILGNQTLMQPASVRFDDDRPLVFTDGWDGYFGERDALLAILGDTRVANTVVLSGDVHAFYANALARDDARPHERVVATEFVCGAVTAPAPSARFVARVQAEHPAVRFTHADKRGYVRFDVDARELRASMIGMSSVREPGGRALELASFRVAAGRAGPERLSGPAR
ncbi:MAG: alkaline phosphatase D family protein [Burkholderiaceae bacterium]